MMNNPVETITLRMPMHLGSVNCYLVKCAGGFVLVDSGFSGQREELLRRLEAAGCRPGDLKLIVITHGDFDHTGNAAALHARYGCPVGMHPDDRGMTEQGDMFYGRKQSNALLSWLSPRIFGFRPADRFQAGLALVEGFDLAPYGWAARVVELPGHSRGSIGVLSADGDLFCGDLLDSTGRQIGPGMGDPADFSGSINRVKGMAVRRIYPGHGPAFEPGAIP